MPTLNIKNYELTLPLGRKHTENTIKIFPKLTNQNITHVLIRFSVSDNDNSKTGKHLFEDTTTKLRHVRLFLGENEREKILDFLRNEKNPKFTFNFDSENFTSFGFHDFLDGDIFRNVNSFKVGSFKLHSRAANKSIFNSLKNIFIAVTDN